MRNIDRRLDLIKNKIHEETFIDGRGLGNELSFYIFDYDPRDELKVRDHVDYLINDYFKAPHHNRRIIEFNLYEMFLDITKEKNIYDKIFEMEEKEGKEFLYRALTTFAMTTATTLYHRCQVLYQGLPSFVPPIAIKCTTYVNTPYPAKPTLDKGCF